MSDNNEELSDYMDTPEELEEMSSDIESVPSEPEAVLPSLEMMQEFDFLLKQKSRAFIFETIPKIQESRNCDPHKAVYILARTLGFSHRFLQDDKDIAKLKQTFMELNLNIP